MSRETGTIKSSSDTRVEKDPTPIVFNGERFDVMSVRRWRDKLLKPQ